MNSQTGNDDLPPAWQPEAAQLGIRSQQSSAGISELTSVSHPTAPFPSANFYPAFGDDAAANWRALERLAGAYLGRLQTMGFSLPGAESLVSGGIGSSLALRWLEPATDPAVPPTALQANSQSFVVARSTPGALAATALKLPGVTESASELTVILIASPGGLVGEQGLRVVVHLDRPTLGAWRARITGVTASNLEQLAHALAADIHPLIRAFFGIDVQAASVAQVSVDRFAASPIDSMQSLFDRLRLNRQVTGLSLVPMQGTAAIRVFSQALPPRADQPMVNLRTVERAVHDLVVQRGDDGPPQVLLRARLDEVAALNEVRSADAAAPSEFRIFPHDLASLAPGKPLVQRRPTRSASQLDPLRRPSPSLAALMQAGDPAITLSDPQGFWQVMAPAYRQAAPAAASFKLPNNAAIPDEPPLRSDSLSAAHAYERAAWFFGCLQGYGLSVRSYVRHAQLPLRVQHHAPFRGAADGRVVNAQVQALDDVAEPSALPTLEVSFGAANLSHRSLQAVVTSCCPEPVMRAQPMGLAADARWAWHEFGHVLNFASFGNVEFRFAHSLGDALAAISHDPTSTLTTHALTRSLTFPWAAITRRHTRSAALGWSWCGRRNPTRRTPADGLRDRRLGYFEEQLLSSSLFRFYQILGGDTQQADVAAGTANPARYAQRARRRASEYCIYLMMRGVNQFAPDLLVPARQVEVLVDALIDADINTHDWQMTSVWPRHLPVQSHRRWGGCAHKALRWAFEQQGLYADDPANPNPQTVEGIGAPPAVDLFIADQRLVDGRLAADGGYWPAPLVWLNRLQLQADSCGWHAAPTSLFVDGGQLQIVVANRGKGVAAAGAVLTVWAVEDRPNAAWQRVGTRAAGAIASGGAQTLVLPAEIDGLAMRGSWWVLAAISSAQDRSNLDPLAGLPCAIDPASPPTGLDVLVRLTGAGRARLSNPIVQALWMDLVALDNNLAFRLVNFD